MAILNSMKLVILVSTVVLSWNVFAAAPVSADSDITANVQNQIAANNSTSKLNVVVTTQNGVVTLTGNINTGAEAEQLVQIAESTPGVKDVNTDKLMVKASNHSLADAIITAKIKGTFVREKLFGDQEVPVFPIKIETTNGIVTLSGVVTDQAQADNAVALARSIKGIKQINSRIQVVASH